MRTGNITRKFTPGERAKALTRLAMGESQKSLAQEYGVDQSAISHMARDNGVSVKAIAQDIQDSTAEIQKRIFTKTLHVLEKKVDTLKDPKELKNVRINDVSSVANDLWKQVQVNEGQPTDITTNKSVEELQVFIQTNSHILSQANPIQVLTQD